MRLLTIPLALALGFALAIGCDAEPDTDDLGFRLAPGPAVQAQCTDDDDCGPGTVCEPNNPFCNPKKSACVAGCHADDDCGQNEFCQQLNCFTCPCPGECLPDNGSGCSDDDDCGQGTVCEPSGPICNVNDMQCVAGCHADNDCANDEICNIVQCVTCPCPGECIPDTSDGCQTDYDCGPGTVCEPSFPDCGVDDMQCVPGCHDKGDCAPGQNCNIVQCVTCPCPGQCL